MLVNKEKCCDYFNEQEYNSKHFVRIADRHYLMSYFVLPYFLPFFFFFGTNHYIFQCFLVYFHATYFTKFFFKKRGALYMGDILKNRKIPLKS